MSAAIFYVFYFCNKCNIYRRVNKTHKTHWLTIIEWVLPSGPFLLIPNYRTKLMFFFVSARMNLLCACARVCVCESNAKIVFSFQIELYVWIWLWLDSLSKWFANVIITITSFAVFVYLCVCVRWHILYRPQSVYIYVVCTRTRFW